MLKARTIAAPLLSLLYLTLGCGAQDDLDAQGQRYDVRDTPALSIARPGVYKTSVEIVEDNCSPSLKQLLDSREGFPPSSYLSHFYAPYSVQELQQGWNVRIRQFYMRPGNSKIDFMSMGDLRCDKDQCIGEFDWTDKGYPNRCARIERWTAQVLINQSRASVLNEIEWTPLPCETNPSSTGFNHTPKASCREKYWMHSDYEEPLECDVPGFRSSSESNDYGGYERANSPSCL